VLGRRGRFNKVGWFVDLSTQKKAPRVAAQKQCFDEPRGTSTLRAVMLILQRPSHLSMPGGRQSSPPLTPHRLPAASAVASLPSVCSLRANPMRDAA